ncbi:MAG: hypothetical protein RLZZ293_730 [Pseudomonadota bacterium]
MQKNSSFDVIIIGAGAAGLMCAQLTGARHKRVLILDHSDKLAEKIRISGGGRCNFTNLQASPECYISQNKHFINSALSRYTPWHFCELLNQHQLSYHEKTLGQLFCNQKSQAIIDLLDFLCQQAQVIRLMSTKIFDIEKTTRGFKLETSQGTFLSEALVIATGGLSIPQIGASSFGYQIARQFDHNIITTAPALVPLCLDKPQLDQLKDLAGVSFFSRVSNEKINFSEHSLFTHRGLSGPAILQISSYWQAGEAIEINLLPEESIFTIIQAQRSSNKLLSNFLGGYLPQRLATSLTKLLGFDPIISQLNKKQLTQISQLIHSFSIHPCGSEGYKKAEVTRGGVDTRQLNSKTMMSNQIEGLYFIGEVVDVTGWLGGYNFQWAWSSAHAVATSF